MRIIVCLIGCTLVGCASNSKTTGPSTAAAADPETQPAAHPLQLGNFSVSLTVRDLAASRAFYEKLGFRVVAGNNKTWSVMQNDSAKIGLFQGMFDKNILTFNPGWDSNRATPPDFQDVREIQKILSSREITLTARADETTTGPAFITLADPDGNQILIDQHVPSPKR